MAKFCSNCGAELDEGVVECSKCGSSTSSQKTNNTKANGPVVKIERRDIVVAIILSVVTCGIYGLYWFYCLTDDSNKASGDYSISAGLALLLSLVTCGIYSLFWYYQMGKKMAQAGANKGITIEDNSILYLILGFFGLGIVCYCLIQNDLNRVAES